MRPPHLRGPLVRGLAAPLIAGERIRARAPLRLGLAGGGTDLSPFCDEHGGAVLNATIDRYAFASLIIRDDAVIGFEADDIGVSEEHAPGESDRSTLLLHRGVYRRMMEEFNGGVDLPMTISTTVDAPAGSGLGSSSALVVALVRALGAALRAPLGNYDVARLAFEIERQDLGLAGGRQDQYAAAFGGINFIEFVDASRVIVNPLRIDDAIHNELESSIVICFSGRSRRSADIIDLQTSGIRAADERTMDALHEMKRNAIEMKSALLVGDLDFMGELLNASWRAKQETASGISTDLIDELIDVALRNGAWAGKVSGAGGGGFMFFFVRPEHRYRLMAALNAAGGTAAPTKFTSKGCEVWRV